MHRLPVHARRAEQRCLGASSAERCVITCALSALLSDLAAPHGRRQVVPFGGEDAQQELFEIYGSFAVAVERLEHTHRDFIGQRDLHHGEELPELLARAPVPRPGLAL